MAKQIGTLGTIDTFSIGGRVITNVSGLITLNQQALTTNFGGFFLPNGTSGYQVTSGKTFAMLGFRIYVLAGTTTLGIAFGYGNTDIGNNAGSAPSGAVYLAGTDSNGAFGGLANNGFLEGVTNFNIPSGKYIFFENKGGSGLNMMVQIFGIES